MLPDPLVFLDLETTGTSPTGDRVIEVGLCQVDAGEVVAEWSSLVNPQKSVPPFIERYTGITTAMVAPAPTFAEIAADLRERLEGRILVAHNARFDYGFLKNEFRRLGIDYRQKTLCTVKLSRALYPRHRRHGLDALIVRHRLPIENRHRAMGDVRATWAFFRKTFDDHSPTAVATTVDRLLQRPSAPSHLPSGQLEAVPASPGIYIFYGENDTVLYVGKSIDLAARVRSHFSGDHRLHKDMRLSQQVRRLDWAATAGELGALLLEARLVKELTPVHNRRLRRVRELVSWRLAPDLDEMRPELVPLQDLAGEDPGSLFGVFRTATEAKKALRELAAEQGLCLKILGLEAGKGACFGYQIKKCRGACVGAEPLPRHRLRLLAALAGIKMRAWPFTGPVGIRETAADGRTDIHLFDAWCHLGTAHGEQEIEELLAAPTALPFDLDGYKILGRYLEKHGSRLEILRFER